LGRNELSDLFSIEALIFRGRVAPPVLLAVVEYEAIQPEHLVNS